MLNGWYKLWDKTALNFSTQKPEMVHQSFVILFIGSLCLFANAIKHEQVHLSLGVDHSEMLVTWVTVDHKGETEPIVRYGKHGEHLSLHSPAEVTHFKEGSTNFFVYRAAMKTLEPNSAYDYQVGGKSDQSTMFHFRTLPKGESWMPSLLIYGDLGLQEGKSVPFLRQDIVQNHYDSIFHIGDFAYDLNDRKGQTGHDFMNDIESVAATIPYMTCAGNHERHDNFSHYDARFTMIGDRQKPDFKKPLSERLNNQFYSLDMGPAHIIVFSSEFYYYYNYFGLEHMDWQYKWLEEELKKANANRAKVPWVIVMAHRPMYCFKRADKSCNLETMEREELRRGWKKADGTRHYGLEDLFFKYGVDLQFYGHEHYYSRTLPVYNHTVMAYEERDGKKNGTSFVNPRAPIHIVTGSAGNKEHHPEFNPQVNTVNWMGYHQPDYGYTRLIFKDKLTVRIEQTSDDRKGMITDDFEVSKTQHSPAWLAY